MRVDKDGAIFVRKRCGWKVIPRGIKKKNTRLARNIKRNGRVDLIRDRREKKSVCRFERVNGRFFIFFIQMFYFLSAADKGHRDKRLARRKIATPLELCETTTTTPPADFGHRAWANSSYARCRIFSVFS